MIENAEAHFNEQTANPTSKQRGGQKKEAQIEADEKKGETRSKSLFEERNRKQLVDQETATINHCKQRISQRAGSVALDNEVDHQSKPVNS